MYTYTPPPELCLLRGPRNSNTPTAMGTPCIQILISKNHFLSKGTRAPYRNVWLQNQGRHSTI